MDFFPLARRKKKAKELFDILQKITIAFLSLLAMIRPVSFSANDYVDILEFTGEAIDGLQYKIPSGIRDYLEKYSAKVHPEILEYINDHNAVGMEFIDK